MTDLTQATKDIIFERANERELYILTGKKNAERVHPAKIYGRLLAYPHIRAINNPDIEAEINWSQVQRMSEGTLNYIEV